MTARVPRAGCSRRRVRTFRSQLIDFMGYIGSQRSPWPSGPTHVRGATTGRGDDPRRCRFENLPWTWGYLLDRAPRVADAVAAVVGAVTA